MWPGIQTYNLVLHLKQSSYSLVLIQTQIILAQLPRQICKNIFQKRSKIKLHNSLFKRCILNYFLILQIKDDSGVVYFADDDNAYDMRIFLEMRKTKKVSVFPVGLLSGRPVSTPIIKNGKVIDFYEGWVGGREFPIDMGGFAFTVKVLQDAARIEQVGMPYSNTDQENGFLKLLNVPITEFQPLVQQCTQVRHEITF
jgi:hypothetical protein